MFLDCHLQFLKSIFGIFILWFINEADLNRKICIAYLDLNVAYYS
jgi:hypothetical protein